MIKPGGNPMSTPTALLTGLGLVLASVAAGTPVLAKATVTQELETGYQRRTVSSPEAKFEEYGEIPNGGVIRRYRLASETDRTQVTFQAKDVRQNNQSYQLSLSHDWKYKVEGAWDQIPHNFSNEARSLYASVSPGVLRLPVQVKADLQDKGTSDFISLYKDFMTAAQLADLRFRDDKGRVNLGFAPTDRLRFNVGVSRDEISGNRAKGASFGFSHVVELPEPVDRKVYHMTVGTEYATPQVQWGLRYALSSFNNAVETLIWDNAKRTSDQAVSASGYVAGDQSAQGRMNLAPDNVSHSTSFSAGVKLPWRSRFTMDSSLGYLFQNRDLLAYTINSAVKPGAANSPPFDASDRANLPVSRPGARMLTWAQNYALVNRFWKPVTLGVRFRSYQLNNRTPEVSFPGQVRFDQVWETGPFVTERFQFRKETLEGGVDWAILQPLSAGVKYAVEWAKREHREVKETTEQSATVSTDFKPFQWFLARGTYINARRTMGGFEVDDFKSGGTFAELPGLRRYDVSDRTRNQGKLLLQMTPGPVSLAVTGGLAHDNYQPGKGDLTGGVTDNQSLMYGFLENRNTLGGVDVGWDLSTHVGVSAYYQFEQNRGLQRSNMNGATVTQDAPNDWSVRTLERYHTAGLVTDLTAIPDLVDVRFGYEITASAGAMNYVNLGSALSKVSPEETKTSRQDIYLRTDVKATSHVSLVFGYLFQKYDVRDFASQKVPFVGGAGTSQTNIFLSDNSKDYKAHVGSVLVKYQW